MILDEDWQFFSDDELPSSGDWARLVSLRQILELDSTIIELYDLPINYVASRVNISDEWLITKAE